MSHSDEAEVKKCLAAMESRDLDPLENSYCITFDGNFQTTYDAVSVLEKLKSQWHYFVFERGDFRNHSYFQNTIQALNSLYWHFVRPSPNYTVVYNKFGKGSDAFVDQIAQEQEAFEFACAHLGVPADRYLLEIGNRAYQDMADGWICRPSKTGWAILKRHRRVDAIAGDFEALSDALEFMFWSLTNAQTYGERYAEISASG